MDTPVLCKGIFKCSPAVCPSLRFEENRKNLFYEKASYSYVTNILRNPQSHHIGTYRSTTSTQIEPSTFNNAKGSIEVARVWNEFWREKMYGQQLICDPHEQVSCLVEIERKNGFNKRTFKEESAFNRIWDLNKCVSSHL